MVIFLSQTLRGWENWERRKVHARRLNAKEIITPKDGQHFTFPITNGTVNLSGGNKVFWKSSLIRDHTEKSEELRDDLRGESGASWVDREELHLSSSR